MYEYFQNANISNFFRTYAYKKKIKKKTVISLACPDI